MKLYSLAVEEKLVKEVDNLVKELGMYSSRSDFIRDAIRARLIEIRKLAADSAAEADSEHEEGPARKPKVAEDSHAHAYRGVH